MKSKCSIRSTKLPPVPEMTRPTYKKPEIIKPGPGVKAIKLPCGYSPRPAPPSQSAARGRENRQPKKHYKEWSEERLNRLIELHAQGKKLKEIAEDPQVSTTVEMAGAMVSKMRRAGRIPPANRKVWTAEEDEILVDMLGQGKTHGQIALRLGRATSSVTKRTKKLKPK